jgi:hypothetical protein
MLAGLNVELTQELYEFVGCNLGFYQVTIGLVFDICPHVVTLFEVGGNDDFGVHLWGFAWVTQCSQNFNPCDVGDHQIK